jgi:hypothetical protein
MTLRDLEEHGLLTLPNSNTWEREDLNFQGDVFEGDPGTLTLVCINMWGKSGRDDTIYLRGQDNHGHYYSSEITNYSTCLAHYFMSIFLVDSYGMKMTDVFSKKLSVSEESASLFDEDFISTKIQIARLMGRPITSL